MIYPIYQEIPYCDPLEIFAELAKQSGAILLDSAQLSPSGRYSFIATDPFQILTSKNGEIFLNNEVVTGNPFQILSKQLSQFSLSYHLDLPPFQGGVAGFFAYDLYQHLEKIHSTQVDDIEFPDLILGFYDVVVTFDHVLKRAWIFSSGFPEMEVCQREQRAVERLQLCSKHLQPKILTNAFFKKDIDALSNFTEQQYCEAVTKVKEYILKGDVFEANISQRFLATLPNRIGHFDLYRQLRTINPAPFSAYINFDKITLISASPERFIKLSNKHVETRPIKGTIKRGKTIEEDQVLAKKLMRSEKDHAENVMIVDLLRNDLSRVCKDHSVHVTQLCELETYASVHHLVSVVTGELQPQYNAIDLLCATFPGGSITGAPKIRAMEVIAEIEPTKRGPYCGCIGYIGFNGDMDTSITIRTFAIKDNKIFFQAGGAIVLDSDPLDEYQETLTKAQALRKVLQDDFVN